MDPSWLYYTYTPADQKREKRRVGPGTRISDRAERIRLARRAVERLLDAGLVEIWRWRRPEEEDELLSVDEAKAFLTDGKNWIYNEADPPEYVTVVLAAAGHDVLVAGG